MSTGIAICSSIDFNLPVSYWLTLRKIGIPFFILIVIGTSMDQWITLKMERLLMNPAGTSHFVWLYGALSLILNLTYPLMGTLLALSVTKNQNWVQFLHLNFKQNLIEEMRAWGKAMAWSLALIIPGLVRMIQYFFVPFVVSLNPAYQCGEIDALSESRRLSKGHFFALLGLFIGFSFVAPGLLTIFDEWKLIWKTPVQALIICFLEMLINLWFIYLLFKLYQKGVSNEPAVSVERN